MDIPLSFFIKETYPGSTPWGWILRIEGTITDEQLEKLGINRSQIYLEGMGETNSISNEAMKHLLTGSSEREKPEDTC